MSINYFGWGCSDINLADIDFDGDFDAFVGGSYISLYYNLGTLNQPNFSIEPDTLFDINLNIINGTHVALVDIDQDGDYDLFAGHYSGYIKFYENVGTPTNYAYQLISSNWFNTYTSQGYADPCFGDIDADGDLDLLVGTGQGKVYYYQNQGSAQIPQMVYMTNNFYNIDVQEDASPELTDIDGDGDLDLFVGRDAQFGQSPTQGDIFFYENIGTPQVYNFQYCTSNYLTFDCGYGCTPQLVDIDADDDYDLLSHIGSKLLLYRNQGTTDSAYFVYETSNFGGIDVFDIVPWFCDIDGDGDLDLFAGTSAIPGPPGLILYLNQGTPRNPIYVLYSNNLVPGVFNQSSVILVPGTADIDADGDKDLFVSDDNGYFYFFENMGTPTQFQFQYLTSNWQNLSGNAVHRYFYFYDIDNDEDLDLFYYLNYGTNDKTLGFYRNVGTPQVANMVLETDNLFPDLIIWQAVPFVIDIDRDGDGDLFVGDTWGGCRFFRNLEIENLPRTLTIIVSGNDVILHWEPATLVNQYLIYYQDTPYFTPTGIPQAVVFPPDTSWADENALFQVKRYYRVVVEY
jgi:hypothetical protein